MSYINLFGVLKTFEVLCKIDDEAKEIAMKKTTVSINVKGGGKAKLVFGDGKCKMMKGVLGGKIKLLLTSPQKLNDMIDGNGNPIPYWGFTQLNFLLKGFSRLAEILGTYLKPTPEQLEDRDFYEKSTILMFHLIANSISVLGHDDDISKFTSAYMPDGEISMIIKDKSAATIFVKNGVMKTFNRKSEHPRSFMIFDSLETARGMFDGTLSSMNCLAEGKIEMKGFIPMIDNLNKMLGRVAIYLG